MASVTSRSTVGAGPGGAVGTPRRARNVGVSGLAPVKVAAASTPASGVPAVAKRPGTLPQCWHKA